MFLLRKEPQQIFPHIELSSARINMRPPQEKDWPQWADIRGQNQVYLKPFEPTWGKDCLSEDFFHRRLQLQSREWKEGRACAFLIFENDRDELIGGMNINNICRGAAQFASLGFWLAEDKQGKGYMAEALRLTVDYCFSELKLHRVNASCLPHNTRSKNLLLKAGFNEEGFAKNYLQIDGLWQDHILFGLPVESWLRI
jgi:ribosomal-protein-alanine N-acetyltransferase